MNKLVLRVFTILLVILMSFLPLFLSAYFSVFNQGFYRSEFARYGVYEKYGDVDMDRYNQDVLDYLRGEKESMPVEIELTEKELKHMGDVRDVFSLFILLFKIIILVVIALFFSLFHLDKKRIIKRVSKVFIRSGIISIIFGFLLLIFFYFGFESSFSSFHSLFFAEGSWLFIASANIINIYPEPLFFDIFVRVFSLKMIFAALFLISGLLLRKKFINGGS